MKKWMKVSSILTLGVLALGVGYLSGYQTTPTEAEQNQIAVQNQQVVQKISNRALTASVMTLLKEDFAKLANDASLVTQENLDILSYYASVYYQNQIGVVVADKDFKTIDASDIIATLNKLADSANLQKAFDIEFDGNEIKSIKIIRDLKKPEKFDDLVSSIKSDVQSQLTENKRNDKLEVNTKGSILQLERETD